MTRLAESILIAYLFVGLSVALVSGVDRPKQGRPCDVLLVRSCTVHDADTLTKCEIVMPWGKDVKVDQAIRLADVDAFEVSKQRQTVEVTDAEVAKGKEARDKLIALAKGGEWWVRPRGDSVYGRLQGDLFIHKGDEWISVRDWIKREGYERPGK